MMLRTVGNEKNVTILLQSSVRKDRETDISYVFIIIARCKVLYLWTTKFGAEYWTTEMKRTKKRVWLKIPVLIIIINT